MEHTGKLKIDGKNYLCKVINGQRFIDGKTVDEFMILHPELLKRAAFVGKIALQDEKKGIKPQKGKYQYLMNNLPFNE